MATAHLERRLTAILAADVAGYSRLTGLDEEGTHVRLKEHLRALVNPKIGEHRGHVVKNTGDGILAEFSSVVDAVRCAVDVQRGMVERNSALPRERRIEFRIGINVGDVIIDDDDIFGDGVNVAVRLEGIAEPGGICVSDRVQEYVRGQFAIAFEDAGEQRLKNIARPVRAYAIKIGTTAGFPVGSVTRDSAMEVRAEKPGVAVLPLADLGGETSQEYFADGVTEDLISGLSRVRWLRVISRSSSFSFKGKQADPKQVANDLGVRYIVGGSIRRAGNRVRIGVELVDGSNGIQLWSRHYDRLLQDIFNVQDEIVQTVLGAVEPEMTAAEWERARSRPANNLDAWDQYRRGTWHLYRFGSDDIRAAKKHCRAAIASDGQFAQAYAMLGYACHLSLIFDYVSNRSGTLREGLKAAKRAIELDGRDSFAHAILGRLYMMGREHELAVEKTHEAIELNPHSPQAHYGLGFALVVAGQPREAIGPLLKAVELSPRDPNLASYGTVLATAYLLLDNPAKSVEWAQIATRQVSSHFIAHMLLVIALAKNGDMQGAQRARKSLLALKPDFRRDYIRRCWPFKRRSDEILLTEELRKLNV
ncbi:adenylate/guanylate cyclase domain-containing protein [Bradyrhizobium sp. USDA 10063]